MSFNTLSGVWSVIFLATSSNTLFYPTRKNPTSEQWGNACNFNILWRWIVSCRKSCTPEIPVFILQKNTFSVNINAPNFYVLKYDEMLGQYVLLFSGLPWLYGNATTNIILLIIVFWLQLRVVAFSKHIKSPYILYLSKFLYTTMTYPAYFYHFFFFINV